MVVCSATNVESCLCLKARKVWQEKKSEQDTVTIKNDILRKYFPRSYTPRQMEEKIIQLLDAWQQQRQQAKLKKRKQEAER